MSLPPGFLDELRERVSLSDIAGRKVTWDKRKSQPSKGDWWAPCPFHQEKTPSFHVDDRKGFYYCFGCQAKGDAITFLKEAENLSFIEAVERLASEAGMAMPAEQRDPAAAEKRNHLARLAEVMEQAVRLFGLGFRGQAGVGARAYAERRGLTADTLKRFEIGYAPDARHTLTQHFQQRGQLDDAITAGLVIKPEDGGQPYDRFRDRLMFPIRDGRGRCIAFGGRALGQGAMAKYLNSPETPLFHKGRTLYNVGPAREAAGKSGQLLVAEGYMDVIALAQAGFDHAVAPLGTAITEAQLALMWKIAPEPVIALDGDAAGLRAAHKLVDLALPHLAPGRSLGFCLMPEGQDPDDLITAEGADGMAAAIAAAVPLSEVLWRREAEAAPIDTPERRAALDARLKAALGQIADPAVRVHYAAAFREKRRALFEPPRPAAPGPAPMGRRMPMVSGGIGGGPGGGRPGMAGRRGWLPPQGPTTETRNSWLAKAPRESALRNREATILAIALANPDAAAALEHEIEDMPLIAPDLEPLRGALVEALGAGEASAEAIAARLSEAPETTLARYPGARAHPLVGARQPMARARAILAEAIARHRAELACAAERADARGEFAEAEGEDWTWRLRQAELDRLRIESDALRDGAESEDDEPSLARKILRDGSHLKKKGGPPPSNQ